MMFIRKATAADYRSIARSLANKQISYITPHHAHTDIENGNLYVIEDNGTILAQCALVYEPQYGYHAIKRLVVYNRKNLGCGLAQRFLSYFTAMPYTLGCTPWADNEQMKYLLRKNGFDYEYTFCENYQLFIRIQGLTNLQKCAIISSSKERN